MPIAGVWHLECVRGVVSWIQAWHVCRHYTLCTGAGISIRLWALCRGVSSFIRTAYVYCGTAFDTLLGEHQA
jgi:hypothetical protein